MEVGKARITELENQEFGNPEFGNPEFGIFGIPEINQKIKNK